MGNKETSSGFTGRTYVDKLKEHPHSKLFELIDDFHKEFGAIVLIDNGLKFQICNRHGDHSEGKEASSIFQKMSGLIYNFRREDGVTKFARGGLQCQKVDSQDTQWIY